MAKATKNPNPNLVNIRITPIQGIIKQHEKATVIGAYKYEHADSRIVAYVIDKAAIEDKVIFPYEDEMDYNSIYFLFGFDGHKDIVYVGQAGIRNNGKSVLKRLSEHIVSKNEKYSNYWKYAVVVTNENNTWGGTELNALEHFFIVDIPKENSTGQINHSSGGAKQEDYEEKIKYIKRYFRALNISIFDKDANANTSNNADEESIQLTENISVEDLQNGVSSIPEIVTPRKVVKAMVDLLPDEVWNRHTAFIDLACKGGEYLREVYDRLMECDDLLKIKDRTERSNYILGKQLYGIALSQVSKDRTMKNLRIYNDSPIRIIPKYINKLEVLSKFADKVLEEKEKGNSVTFKNDLVEAIKEWIDKDMKMKVVIGNPPYNDTDNTGSSKSINTYFVELGIQLNAKYQCVIMPNRWFLSDDKLNAKCRTSLIGKIKYLRDYEDAANIFKGVSIAGGVSYFLYDRDYDGNMIYDDGTGKIETKHNKNYLCRGIASNIIYNHVKNKAMQFMDDKRISTSFFGLTRNTEGHTIKTDKNNILLKSSRGGSYLSIDDIKRNKERL